ncbi:50S ribosomal protein L19e [Candidatus Woesearchaeota archaeon]|nr:50S ribosomal protein L19e [Candidatus Woesearchaeota archaeon]
MKLNVQKRLVANIIKGSKKRVKFDPLRLDEIKEAITKEDIKSLIKDNAIKVVSKRGVSKGRARKKQKQRKKGLRAGPGSRKGTKNARLKRKKIWVNKIRAQRALLKELEKKKLIPKKVYRELYVKSKGGFFRSKRHIKLYLTEQGLLKTKKK